MHQLEHPEHVTWQGKNCSVHFSYYDKPGDRLAIRLVSVGNKDIIDGQPIVTASINLPEYPLNERQVYIPDNEGLMMALMDHKILHYQIAGTVRLGEREIFRCRFTDYIDLPEKPNKKKDNTETRCVASFDKFMEEVVRFTQSNATGQLIRMKVLEMKIYGSQQSNKIVHVVTYQNQPIFASVLIDIPTKLTHGDNQLEVPCNGIIDPAEIKKALKGLKLLV